MCPSSWKLYVDDFPFFSSSLACLEPELELFEVWEINVRQIIIIANGINSQTPKDQTGSPKKEMEIFHDFAIKGGGTPLTEKVACH